MFILRDGEIIWIHFADFHLLGRKQHIKMFEVSAVAYAVFTIRENNQCGGVIFEHSLCLKIPPP